MTYRKKLIEVALPLDAINEACKPETENPFLKGHPRSLHVYWARSPLVACRAILFASLVDDPEQPEAPKELLRAIDDLPTLPQMKQVEGGLRRAKLFHLLEELVRWDNTGNEEILSIARRIIRASTGQNAPPIMDPFCGRGSIPLEAQRLGLSVYASDLNPVAVTITKALLELPQRFRNRRPANPTYAKVTTGEGWKDLSGLREDIRYYGRWVRDEAQNRLSTLFPKGPRGSRIVAWLWARTMQCPNPPCGATMPLVRSFLLTSKGGKDTWIDAIPHSRTGKVEFQVHTGRLSPVEKSEIRRGTKRGKGGKFQCVFCKEHADTDHVYSEGQAGRIGQVLMAAVAHGRGARTYLSPEEVVLVVPKELHDFSWLRAELPKNSRWCSPPMYGLRTYADLFTPRQLTALTTLCDLIREAWDLVLEHSGGDEDYANAVVTYLSCALTRLVDYHSTLCTWNPTNENVSHVFVRQALPPVWDFAEANPIDGTLDFEAATTWVVGALRHVRPSEMPVSIQQLDSTHALAQSDIRPLICTDPPYYDNIGYADMSDYFYVWLRRCLRDVYPELFSTVLTPKGPELVANPYRFEGDRDKADRHFEQGMGKFFALMAKRANPEFPVILYYAFKQEEDEGDGSVARASTGWERMLTGMIDAGYQVVGTWPMRTTKAARAVALDKNALASAIIIACRIRPLHAPLATRRDFLGSLKTELRSELKVLMSGRVAPVDLAQAAIGPGMAVFSRYSKVLEADGEAMTVRTALQEVNYVVEDILAEHEGDLDVESQFCVAWYQQYGVNDGPYGEAETLARAKNVSVEGLARLGLVSAARGKVRLTLREGYDEDWDPREPTRLTAWEACQRLVWTLQKKGEQEAGRLARRLGGLADQARELSFRLYGIADRKGWAEEALGYNALVASWPQIQKYAASATSESVQETLEGFGGR